MSDCKEQILNSLTKDKTCSHIFLSTLLLISSEINDSSILIHSNKPVLDFADKCIDSESFTLEKNFWHGILCLTGNTKVLTENVKIDNFALNLLKMPQKDKLIFLKTCFLANGKYYFNNNNMQNSKGYHLEISFKNKNIAEIVSILFAEFGIDTKISTRSPLTLVYTKSSSSISDIFVCLGAQYSALEIQNALAMRELRNEANRQNNCFESNLEKTIVASTEQINAINYILENYSIEYLDENLRDVALARFANPAVSLKELQQILNGSLSRAGIKYKLDRIIKIYKKLKG